MGMRMDFGATMNLDADMDLDMDLNMSQRVSPAGDEACMPTEAAAPTCQSERATERAAALQERVPAAALLPQYIYELRKGVRQLFLLTMTCHEARQVRQRLAREPVAVHCQAVNDNKVNVFFGSPALVATARLIADRPLHQLSAEADFMLGTLLGYACDQQCERYLRKRSEDATQAEAVARSLACDVSWSA